MASEQFQRFDPRRVPSPCYVVDEAQVEKNLEVLAHVQRESGARVLAALKAFSMFALAPLIARYLRGTCASGLYEARLGREEYGGEVHTFCGGVRRTRSARSAGDLGSRHLQQHVAVAALPRHGDRGER